MTPEEIAAASQLNQSQADRIAQLEAKALEHACDKAEFQKLLDELKTATVNQANQQQVQQVHHQSSSVKLCNTPKMESGMSYKSFVHAISVWEHSVKMY